MKYTYIDNDWNIKETDDLVLVPSFIEKLGNTYFEKKDVIKSEVKEIKEVKEEIDVALLNKAREYCKENKVRGYGLLKDQKLIDTAVANGFTL